MQENDLKEIEGIKEIEEAKYLKVSESLLSLKAGKKGYKAFDMDFQCMGMQYAVGQTYEHPGNFRICASGFHYCAIPLLVDRYYSPYAGHGTRYAEISAEGSIQSLDDKYATNKITIVRELTRAELLQANIGCFINSAGDKTWYQNGVLHCMDGPALTYICGDKYWYQNGLLHRMDGPAVEFANGDKCWHQNNQRHRTDGPAIEYADGDKHWCQHGRLHRTDGPAVEFASGEKQWYLNGVLHRVDGPAIESAVGKHWHQNGKLHRDDGPAIESADGSKQWYNNGMLYKESKPKTKSRAWCLF